MTPDSLASAAAKVSVNGDSDIVKERADGQEPKGARNGSTDNHGVLSTQSAFGTGQGHLNGSHGLKHENAINGNGIVGKEHLRAQSRNFVPLKVPAKLPPPFYPQQPTITADNPHASTSYMTEKDISTTTEDLRGRLPQVQTDIVMFHAAPTDIVTYGGEATPAESSITQTLPSGAAVYPPFPGYAGGKFVLQRH